jgi:AcrR family transcriptional regulator
MPSGRDVTPNRRGARSRETVLDAAERVMAARGYDGATVTEVVREAGIPMSSVYHYFGSREGLLLAVMERGAQRAFALVPPMDGPVGPPAEHFAAMIDLVAPTLDARPDFLRLVVVMATQPPAGVAAEAHDVVDRVRGEALGHLRRHVELAFGLAADGPDADHLARLTLAMIDGAFVAAQADPDLVASDLLRSLPTMLVAARRAMARG